VFTTTRSETFCKRKVEGESAARKTHGLLDGRENSPSSKGGLVRKKTTMKESCNTKDCRTEQRRGRRDTLKGKIRAIHVKKNGFKRGREEQ